MKKKKLKFYKEKGAICVPRGPPLKNGQNKLWAQMKCILKLNSQSVTHMQSFKEICDMVHNVYEDLRETAS